jgi:hypothetical protein
MAAPELRVLSERRFPSSFFSCPPYNPLALTETTQFFYWCVWLRSRRHVFTAPLCSNGRGVDHRKHRFQQFLCCCLLSRCHGNLFVCDRYLVTGLHATVWLFSTNFLLFLKPRKPAVRPYPEAITTTCFYTISYSNVPPYSAVGIAGCMTKGSDFESRWGQEFLLLHVIQTGSGAHPASYPMGTGLVPRG